MSENLLKNPGFEAGKFSPVEGWGSMLVPEGWQAFFMNRPGKKKVPWNEENESGILPPEFKPVKTEAPYLDPPRVYSGTWAICWFAFWKVMDAGLYQQVKVTPGQKLRLTAWAHGWSNGGEGNSEKPSNPKWSEGIGVGFESFFHLADPVWPDRSTTELDGAARNMLFIVGIDPTGGTDAWADTVVWGQGCHSYNAYHELPPAEAVAQSDTVTVFLRVRNMWGFMHNDAYWDDAELVAVGEAVPTPAPAPTVPTPTPTPPTPAPTGQPRGAPRVQFWRTYVLLPQIAGPEWLIAIAGLVTQRGWTIGFSPDDAGVGDLDVRRVIAVNPATIGTGVTAEWYNKHYPGVQFVPVQAATPAELVAQLQLIT